MPLDTLTNGRKSTKGILRAAPSRVATDPRVEPDASCVVCGEPRKPIAIMNDDPFCTTVCCRAYYSVTDPGRR